MSSHNLLQDNINSLIYETTEYDFPLFSKDNKKAEIITKKKRYIESRLRELDSNHLLSDDILGQVWSEALKHAQENFCTLPDALKMNGFYLQELMHYYADKLGQILIKSEEAV